MQSKQVIILRKDLNMRKGKMVAQGAHASVAAFWDAEAIVDEHDPLRLAGMLEEREWIARLQDAIFQWSDPVHTFVKICVGVDTEQELQEIYDKAVAAKLPAVLIVDKGLTEFGGVPTKTAVGIGPAWDEDIDPLTGHLKLL
jgi:peptidyl-tRNA hydrolase, PTH2 family